MGTFNKKRSFKKTASPNSKPTAKASAPPAIDRPPVPVGAQLFGKENPQGMGLFRLSTTVITLIVGAGVFTMSGDQAAGGASGAAIATAWGISGVGVLCLVLTFFALSRLKPHITGGIFVYARKGFGEFLGFASAWGYWWASLLTTVTFCALLFESLAFFFPILGEAPSWGRGTTCGAWRGPRCWCGATQRWPPAASGKFPW
ncbi:amino acid permease [Parvibacter caecicola]|uniref:amino acid permease n=1 Tax=Parvibacter caecicola TaxID=747645 RepID=UPI00214A5D41|nr:amino acid permease [Parvibacter caecicola]MCR2040575.1 amino acid permease [Parvibacter caecicola]